MHWGQPRKSLVGIADFPAKTRTEHVLNGSVTSRSVCSLSCCSIIDGLLRMPIWSHRCVEWISDAVSVSSTVVQCVYQVVRAIAFVLSYMLFVSAGSSLMLGLWRGTLIPSLSTFFFRFLSWFRSLSFISFLYNIIYFMVFLFLLFPFSLFIHFCFLFTLSVSFWMFLSLSFFLWFIFRFLPLLPFSFLLCSFYLYFMLVFGKTVNVCRSEGVIVSAWVSNYRLWQFGWIQLIMMYSLLRRVE